MFGKKRLEAVQESDGGRMDRVELGKPRFLNRKRRKIAPQRLENFVNRAFAPFPVADEAVGNQFFDVRAPQADAQGVAVLERRNSESSSTSRTIPEKSRSRKVFWIFAKVP